MDKKELLDKFYGLLMESKYSGEKEDIDVSFCMLKKAALFLADINLRSLKELVECYEGNLKYYNFLTETEAEGVVDKFINQDGSKGPKWRDSEEMFQKIEELGGKIECEPHYNRWALYVAVNKSASDQHSFIVKWAGDDRDKYLEACYELALTQLKDKDRPFWIRPYYGLSE